MPARNRRIRFYPVPSGDGLVELGVVGYPFLVNELLRCLRIQGLRVYHRDFPTEEPGPFEVDMGILVSVIITMRRADVETLIGVWARSHYLELTG